VLDKVVGSDESLDAVRSSSPVEASLHFSRGGGRTVLARQRVPYPFHATRTFYLDRARPEIATLYLQSASGGLYRGDSVALSIVADPHAAAHVTTQASTIVHRTHHAARKAGEGGLFPEICRGKGPMKSRYLKRLKMTTDVNLLD
jgi:hypothetical protein